MLCTPGGRFLEVGDEKCTHLVVEENSIKELPFVPSKRLYVVKQEVRTYDQFSQHIMSNYKFVILYSFTLAHLSSLDSLVKFCVWFVLSTYFLPIFSFKWFWGSIQMDARAGESMYSYEKVTKN